MNKFQSMLAALPRKEGTAVVDWTEDDLYGRYELSLTVDVGSADAAFEVRRELEEFVRSLRVLGYELRLSSVIGVMSKRREGSSAEGRWRP